MTPRRCNCCNNDRTFPYTAFIPVIAFLSAVLLLILRSRRGESLFEKQKSTQAHKSIRLPEEPIPPDTSTPDDLTRIEGIGPKISAVLIGAGVKRFSQIAAVKPEFLKDILVKAGNRLADPTTWPDQARLAAEGKWDDLAKMQAALKGGRKV